MSFTEELEGMIQQPVHTPHHPTPVSVYSWIKVHGYIQVWEGGKKIRDTGGTGGDHHVGHCVATVCTCTSSVPHMPTWDRVRRGIG